MNHTAVIRYSFHWLGMVWILSEWFVMFALISSFRKIGKRKAALKATESSKKRAAKEKITKKDPDKPKRPPSSFFVFLYVSLNLIWFSNYNIILKIT
jgi:hypothetical protein